MNCWDKTRASPTKVAREDVGSMTYRELLQELQKLSEEQLDCDISVYDEEAEEFFHVDHDLQIQSGNDVLGHGHPYLVI